MHCFANPCRDPENVDRPTQLLREQMLDSLSDRDQHSCWCRWLLARQGKLHRSIMLPEGYRTSTLVNFTRNYLLRLPDMLEHAAKAAESHGLADCKLLLAICLDYLSHPPALEHSNGGQIYDWLVRAYVGHRLLEEMQDWVAGNLGENLLPLDNTRANLLAHELLGGDFCARLEDTIQSLCQLLEQQGADALHEQRQHYSPPPCMLANAMATVWLNEAASPA